MIFLYSLLYALAVVVLFPYEYFRRPRGLRRLWLSEKLGVVRRRTKGSDAVVWIHAVSVGEVLAAVPFIARLRATCAPDIVLSTITDTGRQVALEKAPEGTHVLYLPFDLKPFLRRAIRSLAPDAFLTMETELWPNLFATMGEANIPLFIFNGRISDRSVKGYRKIRFFLKHVFRPVVAAGMQTARDAERIRTIGFPPDRIQVTGNFKFDLPDSLQPPAWTSLIMERTIVAGSTHEGEETIILDAYERLRKDHGPIALVVAPRHPARFSKVERLLRDRGLAYRKRSSLPPGEEIRDTVVLVDVLGELAGIYSAADVCIIGGSFVPVGGHNLFEAAYWAKPIVCGPHMHNFPLTEEFIRHDAVRIATMGTLYDIVSDMLASPHQAVTLGKNAFEVFSTNRGAVEKAMTILMPFLERKHDEHP